MPHSCRLGTEFYAKKTQEFFKANNINHFSTFSPLKCCLIERFHRTIMERLTRWMHHNKTKRYLEALPKIINNYNNSHHTSIRMKPVQVNKSSEVEVFQNLYGRPTKSLEKRKFEPGDNVLLSAQKSLFCKGYSPSFRPEVFTIRRVLNTAPITYELADANGETVHGCAYSHELQRVRHS